MAQLIRPVDLAELRAFCAAVDLGSLGRAARLLRVSQPALSKRMRQLEAIAGAPLLERSSRGITPTGAGSKLYLEARRLLAQAEQVESLLAGLSGEESPVRLAVSHTIAEFVLPSRLVDYELRRERHLSVELVIANSEVVREIIGDGRAHFGIAASQLDADGGGTELPFMEDEVIVAVSADHPWAGAGEIDLDEFVRTPMVVRDPSANTRQVVEATLAAHELTLAPPLAEVGSTSAAKAAALSEGVPVLLSELALTAAGEGLVVCRVRGLRFYRRFSLIVSARETLPSSARSLMEYLLANDS
ncbi:MAG: LysR family transcriptional regulator [Thermoleophilaceae bacterium]